MTEWSLSKSFIYRSLVDAVDNCDVGSPGAELASGLGNIITCWGPAQQRQRREKPPVLSEHVTNLWWETGNSSLDGNDLRTSKEIRRRHKDSPTNIKQGSIVHQRRPMFPAYWNIWLEAHEFILCTLNIVLTGCACGKHVRYLYQRVTLEKFVVLTVLTPRWIYNPTVFSHRATAFLRTAAVCDFAANFLTQFWAFCAS